MEALQQNAGREIDMMLVGNKLDLVKLSHKERKVSFEEASKFAKDKKMLFCEASAYDQTGIKESFDSLLEGVFVIQQSTPIKCTRWRIAQVCH